MRTVNHHLQKRGETFYLVKRIPSDVRSLHSGAEWLRESLKTRNVVTARKMRDVRLAQLDKKWAAYRVLPAGQFLSREQMQEAFDLRKHVHSGDDREEWLRAVDERASEMYDDDIPEGLHGQVGSELAGEFHAIASGAQLPMAIAVDQFLTNAKLKPTTRQLYRVMLKQLSAEFSFIESLTREGIRRFLREYQSSRSRKAVNNLIAAGRSLLSYHDLNPDVFKSHRIDAGKEQIEKGTWTDDELLRLANSNAASQSLRDCITVAMYTGFRRQEVSGLVYDAAKDQIVVMKSLDKTPSAVRRVPCHPLARDAVRRLASQPPVRLKAITDGFRELTDALGLERLTKTDGEPFKRDFHAILHTFASKLATLGADDWRIARILGHARKGVTRRYASKFDPVVDLELI